MSTPSTSPLLIAALSLLCAPLRGQSAMEGADSPSAMSAAVQAAFPAVAHVYVKFKKPGSRRNAYVKVERPTSGVIVDPRGLVVTSWHLVAEALSPAGKPSSEYWLEAQLSGGRSYPARILARDERLDLALLALELGEGKQVPALTMADSTAPPPGTRVAALGYPDGEHRFAFTGVAFRAGGALELRGHRLAAQEVLLSDAALLAATDGGAVVDRRGRLLGLANPSHVLARKLEPKPEDLLGPDYALIITSAAIRKAFRPRLAPGSAPRAGAQEDLAAAVRAAGDAVVSVFADPKGERPRHPGPRDPYARKRVRGLGSGVIIDPGGLVLTSAHIVARSQDAVSVLARNGRSYRGKVLAMRRGFIENIALLKLDLPAGTKLPAARLGSSKAAIQGERIAALGNPYGGALIVSAGVLSARGREGRLQVAARIHAGLDGGALVDITGKLIGIVNALPIELQPRGHDDEPLRETGMGFAAPIDEIRRWFRDELDECAGAPGLHAPPVATPEELAARRSPITRLVERTRTSLLNVYIKVAQERTGGFDPFAEEEAPEFRYESMGSGVIIDRSGLAITNWHVVDSATRRSGEQRADHDVDVSLPSGKTYSARVLSTSRDDDLALLQLRLAPGESVRPTPLGDSDALAVGEPVVAIGNPFGRANTVTAGVVSAKGIDTHIKRRVRLFRGLLQTDAAINPGNSGGALLDLHGRLVGINSAGSNWSAGNGYAIPVNRMRRVFRDKLLSTEKLRSVYVGFQVRQEGDRLLVAALNRLGPAARAGIRSGDRLLKMGGREVASSISFAQALLRARADQPLAVEIERDGEKLRKSLVPISNQVWKIFRQSGMELAALDYAAEAELVRKASVALYRAYSGDARGEPPELMSGALRVVRVHPQEQRAGLDLRGGDLFLGLGLEIVEAGLRRNELVRFENLDEVTRLFDQLATRKGRKVECWILRAGAIRTAELTLRRP